tara:strand:+ start:1929 stop:2882 length:954 start_codon:yes stop_codon:yes gene_type:complete
MLRSGFGSKSSKSLSSTQGGSSTSSDRGGGPDKVIRSLGGSDIKGWYDATNILLAGTANDADLTFWYDKGPDQTHLHQGTAAAKPHYIHDGLNGRPVVRGDGTDDVYKTSDAGGSIKTIDYGASCSVFVLVKAANDDENHGIFGADSDGVIPKSRFGFGSMQKTTPDKMRVECFGTVNNTGEKNFQVDSFYDTGDGLPTCRNQFALYYLEYKINAGQTGAEDTFTRSAYTKEAVSAISTSSTGQTNASEVIVANSNTMAAKGFDTNDFEVFKNIHTAMGHLEGDIAFLLLSNRHYSLGERQRISKAIQQIYGFSNIN